MEIIKLIPDSVWKSRGYHNCLILNAILIESKPVPSSKLSATILHKYQVKLSKQKISGLIRSRLTRFVQIHHEAKYVDRKRLLFSAKPELHHYVDYVQAKAKTK